MDEYSFACKTNGTFVQTFALDAWADLYDFTEGHWHAMLRKEIASPIAHYEWSTENGRITYAQTFAHGEITFNANPILGNNLTLGLAVVEFGGTGVTIGDTLAETMQNLLSYLAVSVDENIQRCDYSLTPITSGAILEITYKTAGMLGNAFAIDVDANATRSAATLTGGGGMLTLEAPMSDIEAFRGDYYYDIRFQIPEDDLYVPIVGGVITFEQGVTRDTGPEE